VNPKPEDVVFIVSRIISIIRIATRAMECVIVKSYGPLRNTLGEIENECISIRQALDMDKSGI